MHLEFQAFDTRHKEMETVEDLYWFEENGVHDSGGNGHHADYILRAFTGLYDVTGKLKVYHKDIVEYEGWLYVVEWDYVNTGFYLADHRHLEEPESEEHLKGFCISKGRKVGNVFENYELIK